MGPFQRPFWCNVPCSDGEKAHTITFVSKLHDWRWLYWGQKCSYCCGVVRKVCTSQTLAFWADRAHLRGLTASFCILTDADAEIEGAPASPLDVVCLDANKDYIIISWKQPAVDGGSPILGYFIDKLVLSLSSVKMHACCLPPLLGEMGWTIFFTGFSPPFSVSLSLSGVHVCLCKFQR